MPDNSFYYHPKLPALELRYGNDNRACYGLHTHNEYSLGAVLTGTANYRYRNKQYSLQRGNTVLIQPNTPHSCNSSNDKVWRYLMLYIQADYWQQLAESEHIVIDGNPMNNQKIFLAFNNLHSVWRDNPDNAFAIESAWIDCFQQLNKSTESTVNYTSLTLKMALEWLNEHLTTDISLEQWATAVGLSHVQLSRLFRQHLHISPYQYYLNERINKAKILLKQNSELDDIAYDLGFADQAHFQRTFKRYTAVTPRQYQKNR